MLVVGEAPGAHEDVAGAPFVGPSGKFLERCLADAGYRPSEVRFTNAVRCRPPSERPNPYPDEIDACRAHLIDEIQRTQPRLVIALGDVALRALTKQSGIGEKRGGTYHLHADFAQPGIQVWPTYHPAFAMRSEGLFARSVIVSDLRRIRASSTPEEPVGWDVWDGRPLRGGLIAFDIETLDADGAIIEHPTQIAVASRIDGILVTQDVQGLAEALLRAQQNGAWIVGHNSWDFDVPKLRAFHTPVLGEGHDTMTLAYLDGEQQPRGLEALCVKYNGVRGWKEDDDEKRLGNLSPDDRFALYNARDAWNTLQLAEVLFDRLGPKRRLLVLLLRSLRNVLSRASAHGIAVDAAEVARVKPGFEAEIARTRALLFHYAGDAWRDPEKTYKEGRQHNPNSPDEVARVCVARGHERLLRRSKTSGKLSVDKLALNIIYEKTGDEYARASLEYRAAAKRLSTYVLPYEKAAAAGDGCVHPTYTVDRTVTNRTSAKNPNVQNLERDLHFFIAKPGKYRAKADYAAIEFRTGAWCAREERIIENYRRDPNWDPHTWFAARTYSMTEQAIKDEHRAMLAAGNNNTKRQIAKSANFSQEYYGTEATLIEYNAKQKPPIFLSWEQARFIHAQWHSAFPSFKGWWYPHTEEMLMQQGYVETVTGFRRHFDGFASLRGPQRTDAIRQAVNVQSQTLAAHIAFIGGVELDARGYKIDGFFHDAWSMEFASQGHFEAQRADIVDALTVTPIRVLREHFGVDFTIPLVVEFST